MKKLIFFFCSLLFSATLQAQPSDSLMLYCTFDDVNSITNPVAGPAGTFNANPVANFTTGQVGNAYIANYLEDKLVSFPKEVIPASRGCIEVWARLFDMPYNIPWGASPSLFEAQLNNSTNWDDPVYLIMFNGNDGRGGAGLTAHVGNGTARTGCWWYDYSYTSIIGNVSAWHHYALSWDINGVPGSQYNMQMYCDGMPVGESGFDCDGGNQTATVFETLFDGAFYIANFQFMDQGSVAIDELKIWNYAKTQFIEQAFIYTVLNDQAICKNDSTAFEVKAVGIPPIHYQWQKGGIDIPGALDSVLNIPQVQPEDAGEYRCIANNDYGADTSNTAFLTVEFAVATVINGFTNVLEYQVATYSAIAMEGHTYEFLVDGGNRIDGTENSVTVHWGTAGEGIVKLIETSEIGCDADTNTLCVNIGSLGIDDQETQNLSVYPNPFTGETTFFYTLTEPAQVILQIYNAYGKLIDTPVNAYQQSGNQEVTWNAENLPPGVYYCRLKTGNQLISKKIIKMN